MLMKPVSSNTADRVFNASAQRWETHNMTQEVLKNTLEDQTLLLNEAGLILNCWMPPQAGFNHPTAYINHSLEEVFPAEMARMFRTALNWVLQTGQSQSLEYPSAADGNWYEASLNPVESHEQAATQVAMLIKNINRRKTAEIALKRFQEGLKTLNQIFLDQSLDRPTQIQAGLELMLNYFQLDYGVVSQIKQDQVQILSARLQNQVVSAEANMLLPLDQTLCQTIWQKQDYVAYQHLEPPGQHPLYTAQTFGCLLGAPIQVEGRPFGTVNFFDAEAYPRPFDEHDREFMLIFARWLGFVLEQDLHIQRLIESNQNKDRIMEIIAHDLRNPLGAIAGLAEFTLRSAPQGAYSSSQEQAIQGISNAAKRANQLLESLLNVEQMETSQQTLRFLPLSLADILSRILQNSEPKATAQKITLQQELMTQARSQIDNLWMTQALENLLSNALKFTPEAGTVKITLNLEGSDLLLKIADTGIGIPDSMQPYIFDKFTRAKRSGLNHEVSTGLGLYLVKQIIELHKGQIWCESQVNQGSCFYIRLPVSKA